MAKPDPWIQGYACACAIAAKLDTQSDGRELASEGGFNREAFEKAGAEPCDIEAVFGEKAHEATQADKWAEDANRRAPVEEPNGNPNCAHDFRNGPTISCPMTCRKCGMDVY